MTTLADLHGKLRIELGDSGEVTWTDAAIDAALVRALREFSLHQPQEKTATLQTSDGSRDLSLAAITDLIEVLAVEFPVGNYPARYVQFQHYGSTLTLLIDETPGAAEDVKLYYGAAHTTSSTMTVPAVYEDIVLLGAAGYATHEKAASSINTANLGGSPVPATYAAYAETKLAQFRKQLRQLPAASRLKSSRLYVAGQQQPSQTEVAWE